MGNIALQAPEGVIECEKPTRSNFKDLTDQQYGRWKVADYYGKKSYVRKSGKLAGKAKYDHYWLCQCECGEQRVARGNELRSGRTISCGCYMRESKTTHGLARHSSYKRYWQMVARCTKSSHPEYPNYGGRGIKVWHTWLEKEDDKGLKQYLWFVDNILGPCPGPEYSVDRQDNDRGYYPWNLRWADKSEQRTNQRTKKLTREDALVIKFGNLPGTLKESADQFGVCQSTISDIRLGKTWSDLTQADYDALVK